MISVFNYTNYREFLKDYYQEKKKTQRGFSYRYFAQKLQKNSSSILKHIIDGKRSLKSESILAFASVIKLNPKETAYFENMVHFNESTKLEEKKIYFERMIAAKEVKSQLIDENQYEFYSKWYYVAIRELLNINDFSGDFAELASKLTPPITAKEAEKGIMLLEKLKFIKKNAKGKYEVIDRTISTGAEVTHLNISNFQNECIKLANEAIDRHHSTTRDVSSLTLSISKDGYDILKKELIEFRKKILQLEQTFVPKDRVYQVNFQMFPLSNVKKGKK